MGIYNVESFLEESIQSVLEQSLNFEKHVQLILINDGSTDSSSTICKKYYNLYPNNIIYHEKENGGISTARNIGLNYAKGKYVNFLDPDDKLSSNTLYNVYRFFENHEEEIDVVSIPLVYFDEKTGDHPLNFKYKQGNRIVDVDKEYNYVQLSSSSSFIKNEALKNVYFDENLFYGEDAELLTKIISRKFKYGLLNNCMYLYRQRLDASSKTQNVNREKSWYIESIQNFTMKIINEAIEVYESVPKYIQSVVFYDLKQRLLAKNATDILDENELLNYKKEVMNVLSFIDADVILSHRFMTIHDKIYALCLKYNKTKSELLEKLYLRDNLLIYACGKVVDNIENQRVMINLMQLKGSTLIMEGILGGVLDKEQSSVVVEYDGKEYTCESTETRMLDKKNLGDITKSYYGFRVEIELNSNKNSNNINFYFADENLRILLTPVFPRFTSRLNDKFDNSYYKGDLFIIKREKKSLLVSRNTESLRRHYEKMYQNELLKKGFDSVVRNRKYFHLVYPFYKNKRIWLFIDRPERADDNAEHLFRYASKADDKVQKYYVLNRNSPDFERMKQYGNVVEFGSNQHKILYLFAEKIISSHCAKWVREPFPGIQFYRDLVKYQFIFLQHGITKDDVSDQLSKHHQRINLFITASEMEYDSIVNGKYGYYKDEVALTGFPRFDNLINQDKKQIVIMPTWNKDLVLPLNRKTFKRDYNPAFKESSYYKYFNKLINDERILKKANEKNYKLLFLPHSEMKQQLSDWVINDQVDLINGNISYQKVFNESSLLITDYSSVVFDFAYEKKPVIYFQFEKNHYQTGYFDYHLHGFGDVFNEYESLVNKILYYLDTDCTMEEKYKKRVDQFYAYTDNNNCKRVYDRINQMDR